ncbi:MAG: DNA translocase FtsK, partial [Candidatus Humimicrobiaceae bacterium]
TILTFLLVISVMVITKISISELFKKVKRLFIKIKPVQYKDTTTSPQKKVSKMDSKKTEKYAPEVIDYSNKEESYKKETAKSFYREEDIEKKKTEQLEMPLVESGEEDEDYRFPPLNLLKKSKHVHPKLYKQNVKERANTLNQVFKDFNLQAKVKRVVRGPSVTLYELALAPGVKVQRLLSLEDDFCVAMGSPDLRFLTPIPGKSAIGIEVPNQIRSLVTLGDVFADKAEELNKKLLRVPLGKNLSGDIVTMDIDEMPHILIGGATNSGKSSCINSFIISLLMKVRPSQAKFILIDPKMVELSVYNGLPHLLTPVVIDPKKAATALSWATEEMDNRFQVLSENNFKSLEEYNYSLKKEKPENLKPLPYIIVIIDELADLMMVSASEVEDSICRIAQKGRAVGIHLVVATQKPIVKIVTGLIQGNIPARIAFNVAKNVDSRVILDQSGAEKLIGKGDMLYKAPTSSSTLRLQGAFVTSKEVQMITKYIKDVKKADYSKEISEKINKKKTVDIEEDELLYDALKVSAEYGHASASLLQRRLKLGYSRAARIIDQLEEKGLVSGYDGSKPREILVSDEEVKTILEKHNKY